MDFFSKANLSPIVVAMLLALISLAGVCSDCLGETPPETVAGQRKVNVVVQEISPTQIRDVITLPGTAEPWLSVNLAAETSGRVEELPVREGDSVATGQILAKIDVTALGAGMARAQAAFNLFDEQLRRRELLFDADIISEEELDQIRSEKIQAREALRQAEIEYARGLVPAPNSGRINKLMIEVGEFVDRGQAIIDLVNIDRIKYQVQVPEMDVRYLQVGQPAAVMVDAYPEQTLSGAIDFIAFRADFATKTFRTQVVVDNPGERIRPGMIARVVFVRRVIPDAVTIPLSALVDRGGERLVYVEEDGIARSRRVRIGVIERDRIQITHGLEFGDRLIVTGQHEVEDGTAVTVQ